MQMPGRKTVLTMTSRNHHCQNGLATWHLHENHPSLPAPPSTQNGASVVTVIVRTVLRPGICMKIVRPRSPQNSVTTNLRLGTVCGFLVFDYAGVEVAKYERSMWKILVGLEKFAKLSESLITFLLKLERKNVEISF